MPPKWLYQVWQWTRSASIFMVLKSVHRRTAPKTERNGFGQVNALGSRSNPRTVRFPSSEFWSPKQRTSIGIDFASARELDDFGRGIAHGENGVDFVTFGAQFRGECREILAVLFHLLAFLELQTLVVPRRPTIGHVHQGQLRVRQFRERTNVAQNRLVGLAILNGNEDRVVHRRNQALNQSRKVCIRSQAFSNAMTLATIQESHFTSGPFTNSPIFNLSLLNITSGKTAKLSCKL